MTSPYVGCYVVAERRDFHLKVNHNSSLIFNLGVKQGILHKTETS